MRIIFFLVLIIAPLRSWADDSRVNLVVSGAPDNVWATVGAMQTITNKSDTPGYGMRSNYYSMAHNPGFDLAAAHLMIARGHAMNHTTFMAQWLVAVCPEDSAALWGCIASEINPVNRGDDLGWHRTRGELPRLTGGLQMVPETTTFGEPGSGSNVLFGFAVARSGSLNKTGKYAKTYNGLLIEQDSIGPDGRGVFFGGATETLRADLPYAPLQVDKNWRHGLDTTNATFADRAALHIGSGQSIALTTDGTITIQFDTKSARVVIQNGDRRLFSIDTSTGDIVAAGKITEKGSP